MNEPNENEKPTIWVVNESGHPTWHALDLIPNAELRPLTVGREQNPLRTDRLAGHLAEGIAKYGKAGDYLLITGSPMINAMALLLWILNFSEAKVIQWNASMRRYELTTVSEDDLRELLSRNLTSPTF